MKVLTAISRLTHHMTILSIIFLFLLLAANVAFGGFIAFEREYTYQASEADSKLSCRTIALEQVKRLLLEELGTYLEGQTEIKNYQLTKDQIVVLTAGIVRSEIINEKWDGKTYYLKAKIAADSSTVSKAIDDLHKDWQKTKELEETRKKANELLKEVEKLKKEIRTASPEKKEEKQRHYSETINGLNAVDLLEKGKSLMFTDNSAAIDAIDKAIELDATNDQAYIIRGGFYALTGENELSFKDFTKAVALAPNDSTVYALRGGAYYRMGNVKEGLKDFDKAIQIDPKKSLPYICRGKIYYELGKYEQSLSDYNKAIELTNNSVNSQDMIFDIFIKAMYYQERGNVYLKLSNYQQAIKDLDKAIELQPKYAEFYESRAYVYGVIGNFQQAIKDFDRALALNPKNSKYYFGRGYSYNAMNEHRLAIKDFDRGLEIDPEVGGAYLIRGLAYFNLGNYQQAFKDYSKTIELEPTNASAFYNRAGTYSKLDSYKHFRSEQMLNDLKVAARLGHMEAQEALKAMNIKWE